MQNYTEIPSSQTLQSSLSLLLNNHKTIMSCFSGTTFPTTDLQVGMMCFRTDQKKLYQLTAIVEGVADWVEIANLSNALSSQISNKLSLTGGTLTGRLVINNATPSTSKTTGALVVSGGVGVGGTLYADALNGPLTGNASTATKLATPRTISMNGAVSANAVNFDGSAAITIPVTSLDASKLKGYVPASVMEGLYDIHISGQAATAASASTLDGYGRARSVNGYIPSCSPGEGIVEIGRYLDFHTTSSSTEDYSVRLQGPAAGGKDLTLVGGLITQNRIYANGLESVAGMNISGNGYISGNFTAGGNVTAYSDKRLKKDIRLVEDALGKVCRIGYYTYTRKDTGKKQAGWLAQEVKKEMPMAVIKTKDKSGKLGFDPLSVNSTLAGLAFNAIRELAKRVEKLEAQA